MKDEEKSENICGKLRIGRKDCKKNMIYEVLDQVYTKYAFIAPQ